MITGYKPNGHFVTATGEGYKIEGETRQCVHCQYTWEYKPGSGAQRGWCMKCAGLICARPECEAEQRRLMAQFPDKTYSCMPFNDYTRRQRDQYDKDPRWKVLPSGIVVANG